MTTRPTKAGAAALAQLLASDVNGLPPTPAADLNQKTLQRLVDDGHVELLTRLTADGRLAAHEAIHPEEGA